MKRKKERPDERNRERIDALHAIPMDAVHAMIQAGHIRHDVAGSQLVAITPEGEAFFRQWMEGTD